MKIAFFSTKAYDKKFFSEATHENLDFTFFEAHLQKNTASLAIGFEAVCVFVNDQLDSAILQELHAGGTRFIVLRCAGFNNVDLKAAETLGMKVVRVPAYSPHAVAEHAVALILSLCRKTHRAYNRVREHNFSLDGLLGFDLHGRTVGVFGTGRIGACFCRIMLGFGCRVIASDPFPDEELQKAGVQYLTFSEILEQADIISLHSPLTPDTFHLLNTQNLNKVKPGLMLINTSRGALIDTGAALKALKSGQLGALGLDVYEEEADLFFEDLSERLIPDDQFALLMTYPNVLITGHQAFFTQEALQAIAAISIANMQELKNNGNCTNEVTQ